jgi:hypothetical protein
MIPFSPSFIPFSSSLSSLIALLHVRKGEDSDEREGVMKGVR